MDTMQMIQEVYTKLIDTESGALRLNKAKLESDSASVTAYWAGTVLRIDIQEKQ